MSERRIMYVCGPCEETFSEACGRFDRNDLRVLPDGKWVCDGCFDDTTQADRGNIDEDEYLSWSDLPAPPEYSPVSSSQDRGAVPDETDPLPNGDL